MLPWNGVISFLRQFDFASGSFEREPLKELSRFSAECENPSFEFVDADLEGLRVDLVEKIVKMRSLIAYNTYPSHLDGYNSVPREWEEEKPVLFHDTVKKLNEAADNICEAYDTLVKTSIRKLGIIDDSDA